MASRVAGLSLTGSVGALEIGSLFSVFLFGIETLQTHLYFQTFKDDKWRLKSLVRYQAVGHGCVA